MFCIVCSLHNVKTRNANFITVTTCYISWWCWTFVRRHTVNAMKYIKDFLLKQLGLLTFVESFLFRIQYFLCELPPNTSYYHYFIFFGGRREERWTWGVGWVGDIIHVSHCRNNAYWYVSISLSIYFIHTRKRKTVWNSSVYVLIRKLHYVQRVTLCTVSSIAKGIWNIL